MKKAILFLLLAVLMQHNVYAQQECGYNDTFWNDTTPINKTYLGVDSRNGFSIPTIGNIHLLLVYVQFTEDSNDLNNIYWPSGELPYYADWLFDTDPNQSVNIPPGLSNFTEYFKDMSFDSFIVTGQHYPQLITISKNGLFSYSAANTRVVDSINNRQSLNLDPAFGMDEFDKWTLLGIPVYEAKALEANDKIDFVLFIYRNSNEVQNWIGAEGGVSAGFGGSLLNYGYENGYVLSRGMS